MSDLRTHGQRERCPKCGQGGMWMRTGNWRGFPDGTMVHFCARCGKIVGTLEDLFKREVEI